MYCPRCLAEYRDGFSECADCGVPLAEGLPPQPSPQHELELVTVLETKDAFGLGLAKAALDDVGIPYLVNSDESLRHGSRGIFGLDPNSLPYQSCRIQVEPDLESEARALLEPLQDPVPLDSVPEE